MRNIAREIADLNPRQQMYLKRRIPLLPENAKHSRLAREKQAELVIKIRGFVAEARALDGSSVS
jgi:hypothetical protein